MAILNIRISDEMKTELQEIAILNNESLSSLALKAITKMIEDEFDYKIALEAHNRRKKNAQTHPINELYQEYGIE